ncbi:MAG TPA: methyltransferase domain-containing protein [Xanthomonadales bacterium]|nr:methyltransferase domain-containing protein [Xanthomonadales bacterium]
MYDDVVRFSEARPNPSRAADDQTVVLPLPMIGPVTGSSASAFEGGRAPALPDYLVRHYWWAYIWRPAVWFFDHQPIINSIVFGQYRKLTDGTLRLIGGRKAGDTLLIAAAYGNLIPRLASSLAGQPLTVIDVAPIQLERARVKLEKIGLADRVRLRRMNAERLAFADNSHDTSLFFLLLHELPDEARRRAVSEALRVTRSGGHLVLAEYGELTRTHWLHRLAPLRWIFGTAEPFLPSLWRQDLDALLAEQAAALGKRVIREERVSIFGGFYRTLRYRIEQA